MHKCKRCLLFIHVERIKLNYEYVSYCNNKKHLKITKWRSFSTLYFSSNASVFGKILILCWRFRDAGQESAQRWFFFLDIPLPLSPFLTPHWPFLFWCAWLGMRLPSNAVLCWSKLTMRNAIIVLQHKYFIPYLDADPKCLTRNTNGLSEWVELNSASVRIWFVWAQDKYGANLIRSYWKSL